MFIRSSKIALCGAVLLSLSVGAVHADPTADARKAIQAQYDVSNAATVKKDVKAAISIYTPDRTIVDSKGKSTNMDVVKAQITAIFAQAASFKANSAIQTIKLTKDTAAVRVKEHGVVILPNPATKKSTTLVLDSVSDDTWVKTGKVWLQKLSKLVSQSVKQDGKPLPVQ